MMAHPNRKQEDIGMNNSVNQNAPQEPIGFDDTPRRIPKSVKWLAGTALGLVILAGAAGLIATQVIDQDKYKALAVSKVKEATGYTIDWEGNINLGLLPLPHASINNLTVKSGNYDVLSVAKADVQVELGALLSKKIHIKSVTIDEPVVTLTTTKSGKQTWVAEAQKSNAASSGEVASPEGSEESSMDIAVDRIVINDGKFVSDNLQSGSKQEFSNLNVDIRAETLSGPFDINGNTEWAGQKIEIKATSGEVSDTEGSYPIQASVMIPSSGINAEFTGTVSATDKAAEGDINLTVDDIATAAKGMSGSKPELPEGLDGKASLAGKLVYTSDRVALDNIALSLGVVSYSGGMAVDGLGGSASPQVSFDLMPTSKAMDKNAAPIVQLLSDLKASAKGTMDGDVIKIANAQIKTQGNDVMLTGTAKTGTPANVDLSISASAINLDAITQKLSGESASGSANSSASSKKDPANMGFALPFTGRIRADIGSLTTGGKTYSNINADISGKSDSLIISNAALSLPEDASVSVKGRIGNTKQLSDMDLTVSAKTANAENLMEAYGITPPDLPQKISTASVNGKFSGDLTNIVFSTTVSALQFNISGEGKVADPLGTPIINTLRFTAKHPNFNEALKTVQPGFAGSSGFYGPMDIAGLVTWGDNQYKISGINGKLGQTTIDGNLSAITAPKMTLGGQLNFGNIVLPSATSGGGTVTATSGATAASAASKERWSTEAIDSAWMRSFDADIKIGAKSITQNLWKLTDAHFAFNLKDGTLTIDDVSAGLFGGKAVINGTIRSGAAAKDPLTIAAKMNVNNVDAQGLMSAVTGKVSHTLTGTLSDVNVAINATGASPSALIQTLSGNGTANGKNIIVQGVDAAQLAATAKGSYKPMERAGSLFQTFQGGSTEFTDFNSEFAIASGIVNFTKIYFDGPKATLNSTGDVNLPAWTVNLKNTMTVKDTDIPAFDFTVKGPLDNPLNSGGDIINNYLSNKLQKKADKLIGKLLGGSSGETTTDGTTSTDGDGATTTQPNAKEQAAKEAVKALQGLFGK